MQLIQTVTVPSGGAASIEFTGIPQDGTDLLLVLSGRSSLTGSVSRHLEVSVNNSGDFIYDTRMLSGNGSSASSSSANASQFLIYSGLNASDATANTFGSASIYFVNYASTTQHKSISAETVTENNGTSANQVIAAGKWGSNSAITSVKIQNMNFVQHTTASLYKITKA